MEPTHIYRRLNIRLPRKISSVILLLLLFSTNSIAMTAQEVFSAASPSTCMVVSVAQNGDASVGSGFVIAHGVVATNQHVVSSAKSTKIECGDVTAEVKQVKVERSGLDLALLFVPSLNRAPLKLSDGKSDLIASKIYVIGSPFGLSNSISDGLVSGIRQDSNSDYIQVSAPINPGNSGGPVLNEQAEVIGIATAKLKGADGVGFAISISKFKNMENFAEQSKAAKSKSNDQDNDIGTALSGDLKFRGIPLGSKCSAILSLEHGNGPGGLRAADIIVWDKSVQRLKRTEPDQTYVGVFKIGHREITALYECRGGLFVRGVMVADSLQVAEDLRYMIENKYGRLDCDKWDLRNGQQNALIESWNRFSKTTNRVRGYRQFSADNDRCRIKVNSSWILFFPFDVNDSYYSSSITMYYSDDIYNKASKIKALLDSSTNSDKDI